MIPPIRASDIGAALVMLAFMAVVLLGMPMVGMLIEEIPQ
jgi:hypothetical protein